MLNFIFIKSTNFGDAINRTFWEKIIDTNIGQCNRDKIHFITTGSIMSLINKNSIILGTGFISENNDIGGDNMFSNTNQIIHTPYSILAVRGPLSRQKFIDNNIYCPETYGDPLILFPCIYNKFTNIEDNIVGIIPHYIDINSDKVNLLKKNLEDNNYKVHIINIETSDEYENFINEINQCKYIVSSSLHGIIMGLLYKKKTIYLEFSKNVIGDKFKFNDFFGSLNINYNYIIDYSVNILYNIINIDYSRLNKLGKNLINVCPFISDIRKQYLINIYNNIYSSKKNLVMTTLINYEYDIHYRFIGTLFDNVKNVKVVVFITKNDEKHINRIKDIYPNYNIETMQIHMKDIHIVNLRFKLYYNYLVENENIYDLIFLCDSRDVIFQKDIFTHPIINNKYDLYLFEEESNDITIDRCQFNSLYVKKSQLNINDLVKNKNILCVGTILGKHKGIIEYLNNFNYILDNEVPHHQKNLYGVDSGINYKIIYGNLLKNINILFCSNKNFLVYTMAFPIYLNLIDYQKLLNNNNQIMYHNNICYCIHQYDRLNDVVKKQISNKYNLMI